MGKVIYGNESTYQRESMIMCLEANGYGCTRGNLTSVRILNGNKL